MKKLIFLWIFIMALMVVVEITPVYAGPAFGAYVPFPASVGSDSAERADGLSTFRYKVKAGDTTLISGNIDKPLPAFPGGVIGLRLEIDLRYLGSEVRQGVAKAPVGVSTYDTRLFQDVPLEGEKVVNVPGAPSGAFVARDGKLLVKSEMIAPDSYTMVFNTQSVVGRKHSMVIRFLFIKGTFGSKDLVNQHDIALPVDIVQSDFQLAGNAAADSQSLNEWLTRQQSQRAKGWLVHYPAPPVTPAITPAPKASAPQPAPPVPAPVIAPRQVSTPSYNSVDEIWTVEVKGKNFLFTRKPGVEFTGKASFKYQGESEVSKEISSEKAAFMLPSQNLEYCRIVAAQPGVKYYTWRQ